MTLSIEAAGARYLGIVCQANVAGGALSDEFAAQEDTFLNGGEADVSAVNARAAENLRVDRVAVELFDDAYYMWPEAVVDQVKLVRDSYVAESSTLSQIANATRFEDAYYAQWPDETASSTAAQEIRYQLGLSADTTTSCTGFDQTADTLHGEMLAREAYLAGFAAE